MDNKTIIDGLQAIVTGLSQQADGHAVQAVIFANQGFSKLAKKYAEHAAEERGYVDKCIDRILHLGGAVKNEMKPQTEVILSPEKWIKHDLKVSEEGLAWLKQLIDAAQDDLTTLEILEKYYIDEESDLHWDRQQLELIDKIGLQNWLTQQI